MKLREEPANHPVAMGPVGAFPDVTLLLALSQLIAAATRLALLMCTDENSLDLESFSKSAGWNHPC
jgi:hypothetical protein